MVKIRQFSPQDFESVAKISQESFPHPWSEEYLKKVSQDHARDILIAESDGQIVGYILGYIKSDRSGSIKILAVDPDYRRQGIGQKLINAALEKMKKSGCEEVFLKLRTNNSTADNFYQEIGFERDKTLKGYFSNGDDAYIMRKNLRDG